MGESVPLGEMIAILKQALNAPSSIRALRELDDSSYGLLPFYLGRALVTFAVTGGQVVAVACVQIGSRFSNEHDWVREADGGPLEALSFEEACVLELSLKDAELFSLQ